MLTICSPAAFDACSYFHFLQWAGSHGQHHQASGLILLHQGELPPQWPAPLYQWSILLAQEPTPVFHFTHPLVVTWEQQPWLALQASPTPLLLGFLERFGWNDLSVCLLAPVSAAAPGDDTLPPINIYATTGFLRISTGADHLPLELAFSTSAAPVCNVTSVTHHAM